MSLLEFLKRPRPVTVDDVSAMLVSVDVADRTALFVMLGDDGLVNRLGTGRDDNTENDLFIGHAPLDLFRGVLGRINSAIFNWRGQYTDPALQGIARKVTIGFRLQDGGELMMCWQYGSESAGPPPEVSDFVSVLMDATDSWYKEYKSKTERG